MADNYLEKRMDELRSGRLSIKTKPGIRPNSKRILIAGGTHGSARDKALEFRTEGYRVAVFDDDEAAGKRMAHDHGVRFHHIDLKDENALKKEIHALLNAWRGIDVIVGEEAITPFIDELLREWKISLPLPDQTNSEIVII